MASVKFDGGKCKGATHAKSIIRHNLIDKESRKIAAIENEHINPEKSYLNFSIINLSYAEKCARYDKRITDLDNTTNRNKRKDRTTMQALEIPRPADLPLSQLRPWSSDVVNLIAKMYGANNVVYADVHCDEVHDYIDANTNEWVTSREHLHAGVIPEFDGKLNGKLFHSRKNMRMLNNAIEKMTQEKYGCAFMTGEKKRSRQTIDELKTKSAQLEFEQTQQQINYDLQTIATEKSNLRQSKTQFKQEYNERVATLKRYKKQVDDKQSQIDEREQKLVEREKRIAQLEQTLQRQIQTMNNMLNDTSKLTNDYSRFMSNYLRQKNLKDDCFNKYCDLHDLNDTTTQSSYNNDLSL